MNPLSTGAEMKLAMKPRRSSPATSATMPTVIASAAVIARKSPPPATRSPTVAAESAAVAAEGPTIRCRELPKIA